MKASAKIAIQRRISDRVQRKHDDLLHRLSNTNNPLLKKLLGELSIRPPKICQIIKEKTIHGTYSELDTCAPDLTVLYLDGRNYGILLLEAKVAKSKRSFENLNDQLRGLRGFLNPNGTLTYSFKEALREEGIPPLVLERCSVDIVGITRKKTGRFKIHYQERMRKAS